MVAEGTFQSAINQDIDARVDSTFIIDEIKTTALTDQALAVGATTYGYLSLRKIGGDMVIGTIECENDCTETDVDYELTNSEFFN